MTEYNEAIVEGEDAKVYHYTDSNGKLLCTRFRDEGTKEVNREQLFGYKLCEECHNKKSVRETYLVYTEVPDTDDNGDS